MGRISSDGVGIFSNRSGLRSRFPLLRHGVRQGVRSTVNKRVHAVRNSKTHGDPGEEPDDAFVTVVALQDLGSAKRVPGSVR